MRGTIVKSFVLAALAVVLTAGSLAAQGFSCDVVYPSETWVWSYDRDSTLNVEIWVNSAVPCAGGSLGFALNRRFVRVDSARLGPQVVGAFVQEVAVNDSFFASLDETLSYGFFGGYSVPGQPFFPTGEDVLFGTIYLTYKYDSLQSLEAGNVDFFLDSSYIPPAGDFILTTAAAQNIPCESFINDTVLFSFSGVSNINPGVLPAKFELSQNYPNPFNPDTKIEFAVPRKSQVDLVIYNVMGQRVRTLVNDVLDAGWKQVTWDGMDDYGNEVSSGIYLYKIIAGDFVASKKMTLVK
jgi:hypothetical protein